MSVVNLRRLAVALLLPLLLIGGCGFGLFPEAVFKLASESRLPKWFALPPGLSRADVTVAMYYYISSSGRTAEFELSDANGKKLAAVIGKTKGSAPISLIGVDPSSGLLIRPLYEIVTVNGMTEVIEHRQSGDVFHITDDIEVLTKLGLK
jgi:hypothetical protein